MVMQGSELRAIRKAAGMSQGELAEAVGLSLGFIGDMERATAPIELRTELAVRYVTERVPLASESADLRPKFDKVADAMERLKAAMAAITDE